MHAHIPQGGPQQQQRLVDPAQGLCVSVGVVMVRLTVLLLLVSVDGMFRTIS